MSYAWVTYANNDIFFNAALVLCKSLQNVGTKYQFVILVPYEYQIRKEIHVDIESSFFNIIRVESLDYPSIKYSNERYKSCLNKIHIWNLIQYEKVCWLDSDIIIMQNIDDIFNIELNKNQIIGVLGCLCNVFKNPSLPTLPNICPFNNSENIYLNAGLFIIIPCTDTYNELLQIKYEYPFCEQDAFNYYFKDNIITISSTFNYLNHLHFIHPHISYDNVHVFHFGYNKPWESTGEPIYAKYYTYWKTLYDEVHGDKGIH